MRLAIPEVVALPFAMALPLVTALAGLVATELHAQADPAALSVTVSGLKAAQGKLIACLWSDKAGFPSCAKSRTARRIVLPVSGTTMEVAFPGVRPGRYAVTVEHDENGDGKMSHNFMGMPTEGVGISNNPGGMPGFDKSLFSVNGAGAITVRIRYLFG